MGMNKMYIDREESGGNRGTGGKRVCEREGGTARVTDG